MRLLWGQLDWLLSKVGGEKVAVVGTLSSEPRCLAAPSICKGLSSGNAFCVEIGAEDFAPKEIRIQMEERVGRRRQYAAGCGLKLFEFRTHLLATEDELMELFDEIFTTNRGGVLVLDISCFPKRFFCFFIKLLLSGSLFSNLIVAYTDTGFDGYPKTPLSYSPLPADYIPGFPFVTTDPPDTKFIVTLGFEPLGLRYVIKELRDQERPEFIMSTSSDSEVVRRLWDTAREIAEGKGCLLDRVRFFSPRDVEGVFRHLSREAQKASAVTIAPYGAKLHTLAATLYCMTRTDSAAMVYTQPQWYNPDYSTGVGDTWGYVIKWGGVSCLDRRPFEF